MVRQLTPIPYACCLIACLVTLSSTGLLRCAAVGSADCSCPAIYEPVCSSKSHLTFPNSCIANCTLFGSEAWTHGSCDYDNPFDKCTPATTVTCFGDPCKVTSEGFPEAMTTLCLSVRCTGAEDWGNSRPKQIAPCSAVWVFMNGTAVVLPSNLKYTSTCMCSTDYDPVCGADRQTYTNACASNCAGVLVDYPGECRSLPPDCICPQVYSPVCGSNDRTYENICEAGCDGVLVQYPGACDGATVKRLPPSPPRSIPSGAPAVYGSSTTPLESPSGSSFPSISWMPTPPDDTPRIPPPNSPPIPSPNAQPGISAPNSPPPPSPNTQSGMPLQKNPPPPSQGTNQPSLPPTNPPLSRPNSLPEMPPIKPSFPLSNSPPGLPPNGPIDMASSRPMPLLPGSPTSPHQHPTFMAPPSAPILASTWPPVCSECPMDYHAVCGVDKKNYPHKCIADCLGVTIKKIGKCNHCNDKECIIGKKNDLCILAAPSSLQCWDAKYECRPASDVEHGNVLGKCQLKPAAPPPVKKSHPS
ncbi:hypothetical protein VaNZ11_010605 [Volvox africanus]|uniref:Kazal-like domain-containing protein n=1 Tax=Volvox africanus TaxID=51714 RepID=A0ABQ5SA75_9CHLO|nr:hypothetical protein VaNZ11_010605 [Volvox africanus]